MFQFIKENDIKIVICFRNTHSTGIVRDISNLCIRTKQGANNEVFTKDLAYVIQKVKQQNNLL